MAKVSRHMHLLDNHRVTIVTLVFYLLVSMVTLTYSQDDAEYQMPKHDGVRRIAPVKSKQFDSFIKKERIVVVLWVLPFTQEDKVAQKNWKINEQMLEMSAQLMQNRGLAVGVVNMMENVDLCKKHGVRTSGVVHIYFHGQLMEYTGHRAAEILIPYLLKLKDDPLIIIDGKAKKKTYDSTDSSKVIGYFENSNAAGFRVYREAVRALQPHIQSYAVFDKKMAGKLKLKAPGSIHFHKLFQKQHIVVPSKLSNSAADIVSFINQNKQTVISRVTLEDMASSLNEKKDTHMIMSFIRSKSAEHKPFIRLMKNVAVHNTDKNRGTFNFVWIDPEQFPPAMVEYWETNFKVDTSKPYIGLVNISSVSHPSQWFDIELLKKGHSDNSKQRILQTWLNDVKDGKITLKERTQPADASSSSKHAEATEKSTGDSENVKKEEENKDKVDTPENLSIETLQEKPASEPSAKEEL